MIDTLNFDKMNGLIPAVIQDANNSSVLMIGFMNREALHRTISEKLVTFWSRTKNRIWQKGETSGNFIDVVSIHSDCDGDSVLIKGIPRGPVCHQGTFSCFSGEPDTTPVPVIQELEKVIQLRKEQMPEGSYTAKLLKQGIHQIGKKVGEEAIELALAAQYPDNGPVLEEAADLIYHILVLLASRQLSFSQVENRLQSRF